MSTPTLTPEKRDELRRLLTAPRGVDPVTSAALALLDALDAAEGERDEAHQILDTAYVPRRDGNQEDGPILSLKERIWRYVERIYRGEVATIQKALDAAIKRAEEAERTLAETHAAWQSAEDCLEIVERGDRVCIVCSERDGLKEGLRKHGKHAHNCGIFRPMPRDCDCGLDALLATPDAQGEPSRKEEPDAAK